MKTYSKIPGKLPIMIITSKRTDFLVKQEVRLEYLTHLA